MAKKEKKANFKFYESSIVSKFTIEEANKEYVKKESAKLKKLQKMKLDLKLIKIKLPMNVKTIEKQLKVVKGMSGVYLICLSDERDKDTIKDAVKDYRKKKKTDRVPPVNKESVEDWVIYIGKVESKGKDLKARLLEHIDRTSEGTFALKMSKWLPKKLKSKNMYVYYIDMSENKNMIRTVEKALWEHVGPMVGKK